MTNSTQEGQPARRVTVGRVLLWSGAILLVLLIGALIAAQILVRRAEPILKARVLETLSARFDSRVELDDFGVSVFHGLHVSGRGLRLFPRQADGSKPLFAIQRFSFFATWQQLVRLPMYVDQVDVSGLAINLPPKQERANLPHLGGKKEKIKISIGRLKCDHTVLMIGTDKPGKVPLEFDIAKLQLDSIGPGKPMRFQATLTNPKPVGNIETTGDFGPFQEENPGDTFVQGKYSFNNADLGTLKGIAGTLSSTGTYQGSLNRIAVAGQTTTPDFQLDIANHPVPLNTTFHAIVDGTNGDTQLDPVDAWLLHSHIVATGEVVRSAPNSGHDIRLDVTVSPARIQDLLELGARKDTPLMTGNMQMHTSFHLPPGDQRVIDRLHLAGSFAILDAHFTDDKFQSKVDQLSLRGQGKPKEAKQEGKALKKGNKDAAIEADVASTMRSEFTFSGAAIGLKNMEYRVPGADIGLDGTYSIKDQFLDFHGSARLDAKISQMTTGWKALLLKPVDPFFSKHGGGTFVHIEIGGTRSDPHFGLDFHRKPGEDQNKQPDAGEKTQ